MVWVWNKQYDFFACTYIKYIYIYNLYFYAIIYIQIIILFSYGFISYFESVQFKTKDLLIYWILIYRVSTIYISNRLLIFVLLVSKIRIF